MTQEDIVCLRLRNQRLTGSTFATPWEMVGWLGAVQSQDYAGAKWSVAQRVANCRDADVDAAYNNGKILRTHLLRPTWHFTTPEDIRWLLRASAPRVQALNAYMYRKMELDDAILAKSRDLFAEALRGGRHLTRTQLAGVLAKHGVVADKVRLSCIVMDAELSGVICSGAMSGKQHTYALLDERAPASKPMTDEEATAELARRFYRGHGPATANELAAWASLSPAAVREVTASLKEELICEVVDGRAVWFAPGMDVNALAVDETVYLLSEYDECVLTYKDGGFTDHPWSIPEAPWAGAFSRPVIVDGKRAGVWRRVVDGKSAVVEVQLFASLSTAQLLALDEAVRRYGVFLGVPAKLLKL